MPSEHTPPGIALTIYNQNFALVKDRRSLELTEGRNTIIVEDVATEIDTTSVHFKSLTAPRAVIVREQNYQYDLINPVTLLNKSVGKRITITQKIGEGELRQMPGTLVTPLNEEVAQLPIAYNASVHYNGLVIRTDTGDLLLNPTGEITLHEMPEGLIPRPRLVWLADCAQAGQHEVEISYLTNGVMWKADYVAVVSADDNTLDLTGWVTLDNQSGATYENANLQLIAGDVRRIQPPKIEYMRMAARPMSGGLREMDMAEVPAFTEESLFEYHLYTLDGTTTVRQNEQKQMTLLSANDIPANKRFVYNGQPGQHGVYSPGFRPGEAQDTSKNKKVNVYVDVKNCQPNLGIPLPKGKIRLFKADSQGRLQFVGEDEIDHTPKDETLKLYVGDSFDVTGERKRTQFRRLGKTEVEETFEITLKNHRADAITVNVVEYVYAEWTVLAKNHEFKQVDAGTLEFPIPVAPDGLAVLTYTIRTRW